MQYDGCAEHNFTLQSIIQDARRKQKQAAIAWLDLRNAFGAVPHAAIFNALEWTGLHADSIAVIRRLYRGSYTRVRGEHGATNEIPVRAGVKQGCPLSPIVFNITLEPLLHALARTANYYELEGQKFNVLAYADDLAIIGADREALQRLLNTTKTIAAWSGLQFNARKCATLHVDGRRRSAIGTTFKLGAENLRALSQEEWYEHLGVPTGFSTFSSGEDVLEQMQQHLSRVDESLLAPWQKIDAVNTFIVPQVEFHLKNGNVAKKILHRFDKQVKRSVKKWAHLPQRASAEVLYLSYKEGGFNILPAAVLADIGQVVHAHRLLTSKDRATAELSRATLADVVRKRVGHEPNTEEIVGFINFGTSGDLGKPANDITTTWSRLRTAVRRLKPKINLQLGLDELTVDNAPVSRENAESSLRAAARRFYKERLLRKPDQGKVFGVTTQNSASNHFLRQGGFTRFAEWKFIHRARLNVLPLNGSRPFGSGDKRCRRCGQHDETLPHVINHCKPHLNAITKRHDSIVQRLITAAKKPADGALYANQPIPEYDGQERPVIVIIDNREKTAAIIDIAVPFENRTEAFQTTRQLKKDKYAALAEHFRAKGFRTTVDAFIVGSLGGYCSRNWTALAALKVNKKYAVLMKRLMVSDTIRWSRDIYVKHITGHRQYQDAGPAPAATALE
ncbi:uncharacterized protein LOC113365616 [Ctenocephalides felis]|uniref:uncharacterized protein LOC113365616 n=1 Tax=Ctenocephalides felis TaxID=7515 RepID=UPI000E6E264C|nr:uncharacterized protein LOC113365616 [Ctenocephalides felis]